MNLSLAPLSLVLASASGSVEKNAVFKELLEQGVKMSDGTAVKLPPPILADGLDAAGQKAALEQSGRRPQPGRGVGEEILLRPVVVKVRTVKPAEGEGPAVRRSTCGSSPTATGTF